MYISKQTVFLDLSHLDVPIGAEEHFYDLMNSVYHKLLNTFAGTNLEIVLSPPESGDYSTVVMDNSCVDGSGITGLAEFDTNYIPYDNGVVFLGNIIDVSAQALLSPEEFANFTANVTAHEIGHLSGLDHVDDPGNIMNAESNHNFIDTPLSFTPDQLHVINTNAVIANVDNAQLYSHESDYSLGSDIVDDYGAELYNEGIDDFNEVDDYQGNEDFDGMDDIEMM